MEETTRRTLKKEDFGSDFHWGTSTSSYQIEGAWNAHGKGPSIWDEFSNTKGKVFQDHNGNEACDFYNNWQDDLNLISSMSISNYRFSLSWPRIIPNGTGEVNKEGIKFYNKIIDHCLASNITPWITLYHWDLPLELEKKGGWTNREMVNWFSEYVKVCVSHFGDRVKNWMILNEPMVFTGAGYFLGLHAPGKKGLNNFIPAVHHAALCQAEGGRIIRSMQTNANIGTTFSCSHIDPYRSLKRDEKAAERVDAILNRLFLEPSLGLGYPVDNLKQLRRIEKFMLNGDEKSLAFDFDFIGVQNYTREVVRHSFFTPLINANIVNAEKRNVPLTAMNWEVYPESIYKILKKFNEYPQVKKIIVTENGAAFHDEVQNGEVVDKERKHYLKSHLMQVLRAKKEGIPVDGYFVWSFLDNFEWSEGYYPRFGLVYVDYENQQRIVKDSGHWYSNFLK